MKFLKKNLKTIKWDYGAFIKDTQNDIKDVDKILKVIKSHYTSEEKKLIELKQLVDAQFE